MPFDPKSYAAKSSGFDPKAYASGGSAPEEPGFLSHMLERYDAYTGAPTRAGLVAARGGNNPISAAWEQMGKPAESAPTGKDVALAYGASNKPIIGADYPDLGTPGNSMLDVQPGELAAMNAIVKAGQNVSPADVYGTGVNMTASPDILAGPAIKGARYAAEGLRGLDEVGAIGRSVPKIAPIVKDAEAAVKEGSALRSVPKPNAAEISSAAESLGVPTFEGQLAADKFSQRLEQLLQDSPSLSARGRQEKLRQALESVSGQTAQMVPASDLSKFEVGSDVKKSLLEQLAAEKKPISQLYDTLKESTQNIPVSDRSLQAISRNVQKLPEGQFLGPGKSLIERESQNIANIKTVDDVKRLRTQIRQSLGPTASTQEKYAAAKIQQKLAALEEGTVVRQAKRLADETKDPRVGELVRSLVDDRKSADAQYKEFIGNVSELSQGLGKKRINSPADAERFIESLDSEKVADRLFQKNNSGFMQKFADKYPEQAQRVYGYQKSRIADIATKDGKLNVNTVLREVDKLPKEVQSLMFSKDELSKLKNVRTYMESLPAPGNPSGTNVMRDIGDMFTSPQKSMGLNARDLAARAMLNNKLALNEGALQAVREAGGAAVGKLSGAAQKASKPSRAASTMMNMSPERKRVRAKILEE